MKPPLAERDHVERHHAAEHAPPRQAIAQHGGIADAVLQADDDGIRWRVPGDDVGHGSGIRALDRDQHDAGILKNGRIFRQCEPIARDGLVETFKTRRPQAAGFDFGDHARTRQQRNAAAAGRQHAADEAADAARPCNTDRLARTISPPPRCTGLQIAERADPAYRRRWPPAPCNRHTPPLCFTRGYAEETTMGLLDVLNGMQNGPRGPSTPSAQSDSGGGMSPMTMAILALLAWKGIKHFTRQSGRRRTAPTPAPAPGNVTAGLPGGGAGGI